MAGTAKILVFIDSPDGPLHKVQRELLTLAGTLGEPAAAVSSPPDEALLAELAGYGAATVYQPAAQLEDSLVAPNAAFLANVVREAAPAAVLLENSYEGKETAARLGIKLSSGVVTDAIAVAPDLSVTKSVLAGAYTVVAKVTTGTPLITVKANSIEAAAGTGTGMPVVVEVDPGEPGPAARVTERSAKPASGRPDLGEARVVVAGGRGVNGDFGPIEELADALGGAVGASRAATDAGWIDHSAQVGQTGKTVSPQLYISAGISGAIQQKAGMQTAQVIVAVNKDADSPVFEIADFGVVGDLFQVLPQAAGEIRKRKG
ncbi:electron transfer flavoprotein subunit alpha/FixB family protein [Arthrobacter sp. I2-34]|uniref:Electron transfer flavoprotein subunit alpha/FixB family protein n=1 Tax=Arthrobacter hankyongi TaxID=2904801 RepID=A0ABS9L7V0_9MICC|nr:electron transfer flavoprotein subunit alpha/FixB family protein [Arthrobacter hankyongi]MCG2622756.1 electron transfer flavoprotein subunit alpha/FixB family protein [Arthrobacter hankyongi]